LNDQDPSGKNSEPTLSSNPAGLETRIEQDGDRIEIVATYDGEEARHRVGLHVAKMGTERQRWFLKKGEAEAIHKVLKKVQKKRVTALRAHAFLKAYPGNWR
jgi:hypothetical protein